MDSGQIPDSRRALYYIGIALMVIGGAVFVKFGLLNVISSSPAIETPSFSGSGFPSFSPDGKPLLQRAQETMESSMQGALVGMGLAVIGAVLANIGRAGLAGSGVILDPRQAREDLEPWSRLQGGMVADALDEAKIDFSGPNAKYGEAELPLDERLHRLEQLRKDGLVSEIEYAEARKRILADA